jgi:hypothetical protein
MTTQILLPKAPPPLTTKCHFLSDGCACSARYTSKTDTPNRRNVKNSWFDTFPSKLPELQIKMSKSSSIKTIRCCAQHKLSKTSILLADLKRNGELDRWIVLAKKTTTMLSRWISFGRDRSVTYSGVFFIIVIRKPPRNVTRGSSRGEGTVTIAGTARTIKRCFKNYHP